MASRGNSTNTGLVSPRKAMAMGHKDSGAGFVKDGFVSRQVLDASAGGELADSRRGSSGSAERGDGMRGQAAPDHGKAPKDGYRRDGLA